MTLGQALRSVLAAGLLAAFSSIAPATAEPLSAQQQEAVRDLVRETLRNNPEIVLEALDELQRRREAAQAEQRAGALKANAEALTRDEATPVMGNPEGDVTVVEFFDYQCGYCKRVFPTLLEVAEQDTKVRLAMKEFPILGPVSVFAARAALAAHEQGKYDAFHTALMGLRGSLSEQKVLEVANQVGLDVAKLQADMDDPAIATALANNIALAQELGINGTPAFVVGDQLVPGAISKAALESLIDQARKAEGS